MNIKLIIALIFSCFTCYAAIIEDHEHFSEVMKQSKRYRVYLPPNYYKLNKDYPVIYWMHGHGGTYSMDKYHQQWNKYVEAHDVLLVVPDPKNPNGSTYDYSLVFDNRTYEGIPAHSGKIFSKYFRELVSEVDYKFRTIPDRDHRGISGQSRGGFMSPYIASQNKDLLTASSMSCPSPDGAMVGPMNKEVLFPVHETGRALKGVSLRITSPDGDRYKQYAWELKALWDMMDLDPLEMHVAHYPNHYAADMDKQLDFHMREFEKTHVAPASWHHADPWPDFKAWNYTVSASRERPAIAFMEHVSVNGMIYFSRSFLPDGPIISEEKVTIATDSIYVPSYTYTLVDYNLSTGAFSENEIIANRDGKLNIELKGGGHVLGINKIKDKANLFLADLNNQEDHYAEEGIPSNLTLKVINVGTASSGPVKINITTPKAFIKLSNPTAEIPNINLSQTAECNVEFQISDYTLTIPDGSDNRLDGDEFVSKISLELYYGEGQIKHQSFRVFPVPKIKIVPIDDVIILDGRQLELPFYQNQHHKVSNMSVSGGKGDGDGIAEVGEIVELYVKIPQGLGAADRNTYHRAFLLNQHENPFVRVDKLSYHIRGEEWSGAPCLQSQITLDGATPGRYTANLLLRLESYDFVDEGYENLIQRHQYHFRRLILVINQP